MSRWSRAKRYGGEPSARPPWTSLGLRVGRPTAPHTDGMASTKSSSWVTSCRFAAVRRATSASHARRLNKICFDLAFRQLVGIGPVLLQLNE